jgi:4-alpha-glucanotransferase
MKISLKINYIAKWGQTMYLLVQSTDNTIYQDSQAYLMECDDQFDWSVELDLPNNTSSIRYQYALLDVHKELEKECGKGRELILPKDLELLKVRDFWRNMCGDAPFLTAAFLDCIFRRKEHFLQSVSNKPNLFFRLICPQIESNQHIAIIGNQELLGNWDLNKKLRMDDSQFPFWKLDVDSSSFSGDIEYKYVLVDTASDEVIFWENGHNRKLEPLEGNESLIVNDQHFRRSAPGWKGAGVVLPVFSLRSNESFGIGEFNDLKKLVDWAKLTNQRLIQTLPINDTILYHSNNDSYPYNAVSVFALHPIYINLELMGKLENEKLQTYFNKRKDEFNNLTFVDYQNVLSVKWEYFKLIYDQERDIVFSSADYKEFFESNKSWLKQYAVFSYLRDLYQTPIFSQWPTLSIYDETEVNKMCLPDSSSYNQVAFFFFLQYHAHHQLADAHQYALNNGVALKGDIPIGISPYSVGAWSRPKLFNTHVQAGAPPDDFSVTGQNWGFPTYNWDVMEENSYKWWCNRFEKMSQYFDAYRIDHILGFFRIWEIPTDAVWGLTGRFSPALPFTIKEIISAGLKWNPERYLTPYITFEIIHSTFGIYANEVMMVFLDNHADGTYRFKPQFDTQRKIEAYFAANYSQLGTKEELIRNGLYTLHCQVLFLEDFKEKGKYHPRICIHLSATFRALDPKTQQILDKIYVDFFYHRHNEYWKEKALMKLPALIASTNMLVCGEDLGMIPESVPSVMHELEILSLEIQRMPKRSGIEFGLPSEAPYLSVCTTSTHDMSTLRAWWEEDVMATRRYYNQILGMNGLAPKTCDTWIVERIVNQHLYSSAMWVILPWQDWMALDADLRRENPMDERINVPSSPNNFWCYRMHISLDDLLSQQNFNSQLKGMIVASGR